ncbi:MAG: hypothetical protein OXF07_15865 [Rhodobacter sp.]|nr:hypothetical protein [Rhodobacter sp.]
MKRNPKKCGGPIGPAAWARSATRRGTKRGYKLHIDAADGDVPVSRVLTSASLYDSQAAIPLARMTGERGDRRYELMDAAYDSREIGVHARRDAELKERLAREAHGRPRPQRPRALKAKVERRAVKLLPEGLPRRTARPGARTRQGGAPPHVRRARPDGRPADAARA